MAELIKGVSVTLGADTYVIPPLNFRMLQDLADEIAVVNKGGSFVSDANTRAAFVSVILASIQRNYPDVSHDQLLEVLDVANAQAAMFALLGVSGFERKAKANGEATHVGESTGTASTTT
ncbi:hypothetical protein BGV56_00940 [Burkholderia ubonensis]|uniref:hypothetical protein n=1 Tax=Burkholderia ubonensis TaxID=101571 RepID=UPI000753B40D|nr:hypothetical protein [Burkholderia ubonensis]KVN94977.1 hypothetical protein WJ69_07175 [Burkholderia ubonensis]KVX81216.1 hypothetical protein WL08_10600 [Burkholderia ubonensis]OJB40391.1 hypothetical protein BGV56_00940 [Burkholderia ubonensis]